MAMLIILRSSSGLKGFGSTGWSQWVMMKTRLLKRLRDTAESAFLIVTDIGPTDDDRTNDAVACAFNRNRFLIPATLNGCVSVLPARSGPGLNRWQDGYMPEGAVKLGVDGWLFSRASEYTMLFSGYRTK